MEIKEKERYMRPAHEGYVRAMNKWYWENTVRLVESKNKKTTAHFNRCTVAAAIITLLISFVLHKFRER